jgi:hypothetical protein
MSESRIRTTRALFAAALVSACLFAPGATASTGAAAPEGYQQTDVERQIAHQLSTNPGAKRISANEVAWRDGTVDVVVTVPTPGVEPAAANCPSTKVCVYEGANFGGLRQDFRNCGTATIAINGVSSWHNNQTTNTTSWLLTILGSNLQSTQAVSKVSYVGDGSNDQAKFIHVC